MLDILADRSLTRLVILGDPGSGRSTLARYLLLSLLEARRPRLGEVPKWLDSLAGHLPLLIELRAYRAELLAGQCQCFLEYLHYLGKSQGYGLNHAELAEALRTRPSLVIFDALDEIFDPAERDKATHEIIGFATDYPAARVVVTSRIVDYRRQALDAAGFRDFTLLELEPEQIVQFAKGWFDLVYPNDPEEARFRRERIAKAIQDSPAIRQLAGNPLLLTMIAIIAKHQDLPRERAKLYQHAVKVLCHHWDVTGKKIKPEEMPADFMKQDDKLELLRRVAWRMQTPERGLAGNFILGEDLRDEIRGYLAGRWQLGPVDCARIGDAMIDQLRERNFILCLYGPGVYGFVHRTFLEYLCAAEIVYLFEKAQTTPFEKLRDGYVLRHRRDTSWHEVLRLICGMVAPRFAGALIGALLPPPERASDETTALTLTVQCLAEVDDLNQIAPVCRQVLQVLCAWFEAGPREGLDWQVWRRHEETFNTNAVAALEAIGRKWPSRSDSVLWISNPDKKTSSYEGTDAFARILAALWGELDGTKSQLVTLCDKIDRNDLDLPFEALARLFHSDDDVFRLICRPLTEARSEDRSAAFRAIAVLSRHFTDRPQTKLLLHQAATGDSDASVRNSALWTLGQHFADDPQTKLLLHQAATGDPDAFVRRNALETLGQHFAGDPQIKTLILRAIAEDRDEDARRDALGALAQGWCEHPDRLLLSRDVDAVGPWLDPWALIDDRRVAEVAARLGLTQDAVRQRYEALADDLGLLRLSWRPALDRPA